MKAEYSHTSLIKTIGYKKGESKCHIHLKLGLAEKPSPQMPLTILKTDSQIAVVKESFGNAFSPFMVSHYDEVFIVDQRYFQLGLIDFIQQNGVTDLLFINNIFAANTDIRINEIERIKYQVFVPPVVEEEPQENTEETTEEASEETAEENEEKPSKKKNKKKKNDENDEE